jgi:hypothetical protein
VNADPLPARVNWSLWRRWTVSTTLAEAAGFCVPALAGVAATQAGLSAVATLLLLLAAGAVEGSALGAGQHWAIAGHLRGLPRGEFVGATAAGAILAYAIGMAPSTLGDRLDGAAPALVVPVAVLAGVALLASIGTAQWVVLRRAGYDRPWWILTTAGGWLAGLAVFMFVATPLWQPNQPVALTVAIGVFAGLLMAATVAAVTGFAADRLVRGATRGLQMAER